MWLDCSTLLRPWQNTRHAPCYHPPVLRPVSGQDCAIVSLLNCTKLLSTPWLCKTDGCNTGRVFVRFFLLLSNIIFADLLTYFSKNKKLNVLAVPNGKNQVFAGVRFPDDVISADTVLGEVSACVCQLTAAAPPSVTLATDTCWLWSQIQYTLLSYRGRATPYTASTMNLAFMQFYHLTVTTVTENPCGSQYY